MKSFPRQITAALVLGLLAVAPVCAQEAVNPAAAEPAMPDLGSLQQNWWPYFEGTRAEVEPRVQQFLAALNARIAELEPQNEQSAQEILGAITDNLEVYLTLLDSAPLAAPELPEPAATYSISELLTVAATARAARTAENNGAEAVEREQRILDGATRRRDALFKDYLAAADGDERLLMALRLVRARSAQAIAQRRVAILEGSYRNYTAYANAAAERVELAQQRLATAVDAEGLAALEAVVAERRAAVERAEREQREAQIAASSLNIDTAEARLEQRLQQQRLIAADVNLAAAQVALAEAEAERWWTALSLETDVDLADIEDASLGWTVLVRELSVQLPEWKRRTEDELLAVQATNRDGLDLNSRRLLDQRIGTAQDTLTRIAVFDEGIADLGLLVSAVDNAIAAKSGTLRSWLANLSRSARTTWIRINEFTGTTLFSVGETPVTAGDLLQAAIIVVVAFLLSRGFRYTMRRIGDRESPGAQASLYTIGRLAHYTIIILAAFIALTSIGLDFSKVALVAGALSVGIGFGLQSVVNNFVSGLIILFERSLRVGDYIELDTGLTGTVKSINVRSTLINTNDNIDIVVPNSEFVANRLTNWTLGERILRVRIPFGVAYGSDKELVKKAAMEAAASVQYTLTHMPGREPDIWLVEYGDSSLNFLLLVWVNRQGARRPTRTRAAYLWALHDKLIEYGIEIPFPQRDLHLRSGWPQERRTTPVEADEEDIADLPEDAGEPADPSPA